MSTSTLVERIIPGLSQSRILRNGSGFHPARNSNGSERATTSSVRISPRRVNLSDEQTANLRSRIYKPHLDLEVYSKERQPIETIQNRYEVLKELGKGGMSVVYLAYDTQQNRFVAIKKVRPDKIGDATIIGRFSREADSVMSLPIHSNITPIYSIGDDNGEPFFVMELITGSTLEDLTDLYWDRRNGVDFGIHGREVLFNDMITIVAKTAEALDHIHRRGMVHRDVKGQNILWQPDASEGFIPKLADFGLVRNDNRSMLTSNNNLLGTPTHLAPEIIRGGHVDSRTDLYALGVVLYSICAGRLPFISASSNTNGTTALIHQHLSVKPEQPKSFNSNLDPRLDTISMMLMEKNPDERIQTGQELANELSLIASPTQVGFSL